MSLVIGLKGCAETTVTEQNTAAAVGSGSLPVFATPMMVALIEAAAVNALEGQLAEGETSVGTHMDISHDSATPIGLRVRAEAELTGLEGRCLTFSVSAYDEAGPIGKGAHTRFIVQSERFLAKAGKKVTA